MGLFPISARPEAANSSLVQRQDRRVWWACLFLLCAVLGALLGLSFKTQDNVRRISETAQGKGYEILKVQVLDQQRTIAALRRDNSRLESDMATKSRAAEGLSHDLNGAKFLACLTDVQGPGALVTLDDSKNRAMGNVPASIMPTLIHDTDINQTVNELKAAGAEAISVNGQRLVAMSPVRCAGPTIYINGVPQTPPYVIRAIGDPRTLIGAMNLPGGVADQVRQIDPAMIRFQKSNRLEVPAYIGATQPKYAKPVNVPGADSDQKSGDQQAGGDRPARSDRKVRG